MHSNRNGWTLLHWACFRNDLEAVLRVVLSEDGNWLSSELVDARSENGLTALHVAVSHFSRQQEDMVRSLVLNAGANIEAKSGRVGAVGDRELTPLHLSVIRGNPWMTQLLLELRANTEARTRHGATPLEFALRWRQWQQVQVLLAGGADLSSRTNKGYTPLYLAISCHAPHRIILNMLDRGADAKTKTFYGNGYSALHLAACHHEYLIAQRLLDRGADVNDKAFKDSSTPLHLLCSSSKEHYSNDLVKLLVDRGADVNARDAKGLTPLHLSSERGFYRLARFLINQGGDLEARANDGSTPLQVSFTNGHLRLIRLLLSRGAKAKSDWRVNGKNLLHLAASKGCFSCVRMVLDAGGFDIEAKSNDGSAALELACTGGQHNVVWLLVTRYPWIAVQL